MESDIIIEVLDARFPDKTRNKRIEEKINRKEKQLILVLNKMDLVEKNQIEKEKETLIKKEKLRVVFVSAKERNGISLLKREIQIAKEKKENIIVGMLGYPNSGKSTIINALSGKGKGKVSVSKKAGHTRGLQKIKISDGVYLLDAPGIIPFEERDEFELFLVGAKNANQLKDYETVALKLIQLTGLEKIKEKLFVKGENEEDVLENFAKKKNYFRTGRNADTNRASRELLEMYQRNEL